MFKKFSLSIVSILSCLGLGQLAFAEPINISVLSQADYAQPEQQSVQSESDMLQEFKLKPRLNVWGFTGKDTLAEGQLLFPLYSIHEDAIFAVLEGNYVHDDSSWFIGAGPGYRKVVSDRIYGSHALVEYLNTPHNSFTVIDPGFEMLGNVWDINFNGYIPLNNKKKIGQGGFAGDDFGDFSNARPTGHDYYDHFIQEYEQVGRGVDFSVARVIPHLEDAKLRLGAYHFDTSDSGSVTGVTAKASYYLNKYSSLELQNNYDNVNHNQFLAGIKLTLGGYSKEDKKLYGITTRLLDPIEHVLDNGGLIMVKTYVDKGEQKERDNIWYFKDAPTGETTNSGTTAQQGNGTAEDPFIGFTPDNYAAINPNIGVIDPKPLMYFAPGSYSFSGFNPTDDRFALPNGWGMYGRTEDYKISATGDERAEFDGGLDLNYEEGQGNEPTTVNSIRIINSGTPTSSTDAALYANNASDVILQNIDFESSGVGVYSQNSTLNFDTIKFFGSTNTITGSETPGIFGTSHSTGIEADSSTINFNGGTNTINAHSNGINFNNTSYGVIANNQSTINFNGGTNSITSSTPNITAFGNTSYGISADHSTVNFNGGTNNVTAFANNEFNVIGYGISSSFSTLNFNGGTNNIISDGEGLTSSFGGGLSFGIGAANSTINFNGGTNSISASLSGTNTGSKSYGISADNSAVTFNGGTNIISASTSSAGDASNNQSYGINITDSSTVNFANSSDNKVVIKVSGGATQYGIFADSGSHIQRNGFDLPSTTILADMQQYITFSGGVGSTAGDAVRWEGTGHFTLPWPPAAQEQSQEQPQTQSSDSSPSHPHVIKVTLQTKSAIENQESL